MNGRERPTARQGGRFDMSSAPAHTSAAPASREDALVHGYRNARRGPDRRTETCACGASITAEAGWEFERLVEHYETPQHRAYDALFAARWR